MKRRTIWLSYDLGVRGDYEGLFSWLDKREAKECGPNLAVMTLDSSEDVAAYIKSEISEAIKVDKRTRVYVIYRNKEKLMKGSFLFGGRRAPPWTGFSDQGNDISDTEI